MHLGVLYAGDSFKTDFSSLLHAIDPTISVSVFHPSEKGLLQRLSCLRDSLDGLILTGSARRIAHVREDFLPRKLMDLGIPILGICYGFQWMTWNKGGELHTFQDGTLHVYDKMLTIAEPFRLPRKRYVFSHHDYIYRLPPSWKPVLQHEEQIWMAYDAGTGHIGIQFHPERHHASSEAFFPAWFAWIKKQKQRTR